jgi:hypothetical protein
MADLKRRAKVQRLPQVAGEQEAVSAPLPVSPTITCPTCGATFRITPKYWGSILVCSCRTEIDVPLPVDEV